VEGSTWAPYYDVSRDEPRETLLLALERFDAESGGGERVAVDLGCGTGRDTAELLRRGWHVFAIDSEAEAIERLRARDDVEPTAFERLETEVVRFERATWPDADLVNASYALPFCFPAEFALLWSRIVGSLRPRGRFAGQLFGDRDGWAESPELTFHTRAAVEELLRPLEVERLDEVEEDGTTAIGAPKHWHVFQIVARKT
jgi:SAM-dependent methyltransferase